MNELINAETGEVLPADLTLEEVADKCKAVRMFIEKQGLAVSLNPKRPKEKYVMAEGWQAAAAVLGYTCVIEDIVHDKEGNVVSKARVYRHGEQAGFGVGICGMDEKDNRGNVKFKRLTDRYGMAQTRSISRAYRNCIAFAIRQMDYMACPAEEYPTEVQAKVVSSNVEPVSLPPDDQAEFEYCKAAIEQAQTVEELQDIGQRLKADEVMGEETKEKLRKHWAERNMTLLNI